MSAAERAAPRAEVPAEYVDAVLRAWGVAEGPSGEVAAALTELATAAARAVLATTMGAVLASAADAVARAVTASDRGFKHLADLVDLDGGTLRVCESSLATQPAIRLFVTQGHPELGGTTMAEAHLSFAQARRLADRLNWVCDHHYQLRCGH